MINDFIEEMKHNVRKEVCPKCAQNEEHEIKDCQMETHLISPHRANGLIEKSLTQFAERLRESLQKRMTVAEVEITGRQSVHRVVTEEDVLALLSDQVTEK